MPLSFSSGLQRAGCCNAKQCDQNEQRRSHHTTTCVPVVVLISILWCRRGVFYTRKVREVGRRIVCGPKKHLPRPSVLSPSTLFHKNLGEIVSWKDAVVDSFAGLRPNIPPSSCTPRDIVHNGCPETETEATANTQLSKNIPTMKDNPHSSHTDNKVSDSVTKQGSTLGSHRDLKHSKTRGNKLEKRKGWGETV